MCSCLLPGSCMHAGLRNWGTLTCLKSPQRPRCRERYKAATYHSSRLRGRWANNPPTVTVWRPTRVCIVTSTPSRDLLSHLEMPRLQASRRCLNHSALSCIYPQVCTTLIISWGVLSSGAPGVVRRSTAADGDGFHARSLSSRAARSWL